MSEPSPRQVLYALVSAGFVLVVLVFVVGAAISGLSPTWWTVTVAVLIAFASVWMARHWERTGPMLAIAIGLFLLWMIGTLIVAVSRS
jgi:hypothetical protein